MAKFHFSLVSPERELYAGEVDQVDAPGAEEEMAAFGSKRLGGGGSEAARRAGDENPLVFQSGWHNGPFVW